GRQPRAEGPSDECMSTQFLHAHHSKEPPVSFTKASLRPSDDARDLDDLDDPLVQSEASHSEVREPLAPIDEELVKILSEAVQDLGLDWSPPEQPTKNRLDMRYLQSGRQVAAPQRRAPFFPEVHEEISRLGAPPIRPEPKPRDHVCSLLSTEPTAGVIPSRRPSKKRLQHTFVRPHVGGNLRHRFHRSRAAPRATSRIRLTWQPAKQHPRSTLWPFCRLSKPKCCRRWTRRGRTLPPSKKLRSATDLALRATKKTAQGIGRCMGSLVTLQRHLWLTLTDMRESEKAQLLDAPISPLGLFGDAVGSEKFLEAQKQSVHSTPTTFQILFFPAFKKARKTAAYSFRGSEGGPGASREAKGKAVPLPKEDGTTPFQCGTRSTAA
ncbi:hypothetical protein M9458_026464, partial [Cirrhinus mrigala]